MSAKVSMFAPVKLGGFKYLFIIIGWTDYHTELKAEMAKQLDAFGADLGTSALVLQAYEKSEQKTFDEVSKKDWPSDFRKRLVDEFVPGMLIIDRDFEAFDPAKDRWAVVWFSETTGKDLPKLFHKLSQLSRTGENVFEYLKGLALKDEAKKAAKLGHIARYFELKPQIFGVSIDVGKILEDVSKHFGGKVHDQ
jgi:hypothetical protein